MLQKLPESYGPRHAAWLTLRLKDEGADPAFMDKQIAMFKEAERLRLEKFMRRGRALKIIGTVISALLLLFALTVLFFVLKNRR